MNLIIKTVTIFILSISYLLAEGQCIPSYNPSGHALPLGSSTSPLHRQWLHYGAKTHNEAFYPEEDMCQSNLYNWLLVFEDNFDGNSLDLHKWDISGWCGQGLGYNECGTIADGQITVSDGTLKLRADWDATTTCDSPFNDQPGGFKTPLLKTHQSFPAGRVDVVARIPAMTQDQDIDVAPLWLRSSYDYTGANTTHIINKMQMYKEIDIEFMRHCLSRGQYTLHSEVPNRRYHDSEVLGCDNNISYTTNAWHTFTVIWDMYNVYWLIDFELVDHLSREYKLDLSWGALAIDNCNGVPSAGYYYLDDEFPMFANMGLLIGSLASAGSHEASMFPFTVEYESVKYYRKMSCDKNLHLRTFRSAGGIGYDASGGDQMPATVDNQTPSMITAGTITAGHVTGTGSPYIVRRDDFFWDQEQNLSLYASEAINLLPGFETDLKYQYAPAGESPWPSTDTIHGPYSIPTGWIPRDFFSAEIVGCPMAKTDVDQPNLPNLNKVSPQQIIVPESFTLDLYPNPATDICHIVFDMTAVADVQIDMIDMTGRDVKPISHAGYDMGRSQVDFRTDDIAAGVYLIRFSDSNGNAITKRLVIDHGGK